MSAEHRHRQIRRAKRVLRFMPRRAALHRYPLVGRFAAFARKEQYLWSIRRAPVRRALYGGSILALLPFMGVQIPLGLVLAIVTRANFMVIGLLQLITNPFTVVPIYGATFFLGRESLRALGFELRGAQLPPGWHTMGIGEIAQQMGVSTAISHGAICLLVGGVLSGLVLGAFLDGAYWLGLRTAQAPAAEAATARDAAAPTDGPPHDPP